MYASKCLGFAKCRYNGMVIYDEFIEKLKPHVTFTTACPEVAIGLGVPREPVRVVVKKNIKKLVQPATGLDVTQKMISYSQRLLDGLGDIDGFILKSRSPSCGIKDTKFFSKAEKSASIGRGPGIFGATVLERFPSYPIEDEGRIRNFRIREHFLTSVFTIARFRVLKKQPAMKNIIQFHAENKFLLMSYSQKQMRILGRIVANQKKTKIESVFTRYGELLPTIFAQPPRFTSNINVLMHALGYFSKQISPAEKKYFLDSLDRYRVNKIPLSVLLGILRSWIIRFNEPYLKQQTFFQPYPEEMVEITDSGKGRNIRS